MTCHNCYCSTCAAERAKWDSPRPPQWQQPWLQDLQGRSWYCACGNWHASGFSCEQMRVQCSGFSSLSSRR